MKAMIAGGGIGGIATALALVQRGWDVVVFEQATQIREVGAGIQVSPNGTRVLSALGIYDALRPVLCEPEAIILRLGKGGRRIFSIPLRSIAQKRWQSSYIHIHRADLLDEMHTRLLMLAPQAVQTGIRVEGYRTGEDAVEATLSDGQVVKADLLIGADGLHSAIRAQMHGPAKPQFSGSVAWRALVPADDLGALTPPMASCVWAGARRHAITTRIRGGRVVNFVGVVEGTNQNPPPLELEAARAEVLRDFAGWTAEVRAILSSAQSLERWALFDRPPLPYWADGRVVLIGDAAHPMLPSMAQGAVQALEDAWILARMLDGATDPAQTLRKFQSARVSRTARIQRRSASNLRLFHKSTKLGQLAMYGPLWLADRIRPATLHLPQDWIYGFDATR